MHDDMQSRKGSFMKFDRQMMNGSSPKQKINTTSFTEDEVMAVHDNRTRYFLKAHGHPMKPNVIHQDNMSAVLLEKNGQGFSRKRIRHINVRFFFMADCQKHAQVLR